MSLYLPECNAQTTGSGGSVWVNLPAGASFKPANRGFVFGMWVETPANGYENAVQYNLLSKQAGYTGGNDGYLRFTQAATQLQLVLKNAGTTYMNTTLSGLTQARKMLVMIIQTAANYHLVACEPGGSPLVSSVAGTTAYSVNWSAVDVWSRFGIGSSAGYGHYGPIEEAFFLLGEFPESGGVPDATLIQNIANGTQDLATLDAQLTGTVAKKWRYRMLLQDDLSDAYGIAGDLTVTNGSADKVVLSGGTLRPIALRPTYCRALASQVQFGTVGNAATATATIKVEGGTYSGITPAKIQARLRKEDGTVLSGFDWTDMDVAPSGGTWAAGQFTGVPLTAGWLTCDFRAVDGGGSQIGDIVSSAGWKGAGFNILFESQSQGTFLFNTGNGKASPASMRLQAIHTNNVGNAWRAKKISSLNQNNRLARGIRELGEEINTLYPGAPISASTVGVQGQSLTAWAAGGAYENMWGDFAAFVGLIQPFVLYMIGHSNPTAAYETAIGNVIAKATADVGSPLKVLFGSTPRYAGSGTGSSHTGCLNAREGTRDYVANNPSDAWFASHPQILKCDTGDTGPHPMDADVGQGRHGALLAWGFMGWSKAVEDEPLTLTGAEIQPGGTVHKLVFGPVNAAASSGITLSADAGAGALSGGDIGQPVALALLADASGIAWTGGAIGQPAPLTLQGGAGAIGVAGFDIAQPLSGPSLSADSGNFALAGGAMGQPVAIRMVADATSIDLSGAAIGQPLSLSMQAGAASFVITGGDIALPIGAPTLNAGSGAFALSGGAIGVPFGTLSARRIATESESRNGVTILQR